MTCGVSLVAVVLKPSPRFAPLIRLQLNGQKLDSFGKRRDLRRCRPVLVGDTAGIASASASVLKMVWPVYLASAASGCAQGAVQSRVRRGWDGGHPPAGSPTRLSFN